MCCFLWGLGAVLLFWCWLSLFVVYAYGWLVVRHLLSVFDLDYYALVRNYYSVVFVGFSVFHFLIWIIASWIEIIIVASHAFLPFDLDYC